MKMSGISKENIRRIYQQFSEQKSTFAGAHHSVFSKNIGL